MDPTAQDPSTTTSASSRAETLARLRANAKVPQLTVRAVAVGALVGGVTGLSNLYVGLKTGWSLGVVVTASVMGWALWTFLLRVGLARTPMTILEVNALASTASSAGYSTGVNLVSAIAAYIVVTGHHLPFLQLSAWVLAVALLGVFLAIPMKRQLIDQEELPFPTGRAAAETLQGLHAAGETARKRARALFSALVVGAGLKWCTAGMGAVGSRLELPALAAWSLPAMLPTPSMAEVVPALGVVVSYTFGLEVSGLLVAAGAIVGFRVCWSLLVGAVFCYAGLAPALVAKGVVATASYRAIAGYTLWPGVTLLVVSGLYMFARQWRTVVRALSGLGDSLDAAGSDELESFQVPRRWFWVGSLISGGLCVALAAAFFQIPVHFGILAVGLAFALAFVAARATGETDITPVGPLGKIAQLGFGGLMPGAMVPNLMAASITAGSASSAADLLTDLKSGHLLGANPRKQFLAQLIGVFVGVLVVVPVFRFVLVTTPAALGSAQWPAPAAMIWKSVATVLSRGVGALPPGADAHIAVAAALGLALSLAQTRLSASALRFVPSATGLGLAFVLPAFNSVSFFIGGLLALYAVRRAPDRAAPYVVAISAGVIAGESLMGIAVAVLGA